MSEIAKFGDLQDRIDYDNFQQRPLKFLCWLVLIMKRSLTPQTFSSILRINPVFMGTGGLQKE